MTIQHFRDTRKINPTQPANGNLRPDGSPDDNDRIEIGPTQLAFDEWAAAGLTPPDLESMRLFRLNRIMAGLAERDLDGVLLFDPL
ncbi:MAG: aminopeptidase P family protein, partial [Candidatus Puniceispirillales bacterium]